MEKTTKLSVLSLLLVASAATIAYAALPGTSVPPSSVPPGTLAGNTATAVLSVSAFAQAVEEFENKLKPGSSGRSYAQAATVLQHGIFTPLQSTGWHTHPGPQIVQVVAGSFTLTDEHCNVTTYGPGQGFATGLKVHLAVAGPAGADYYGLYFLPANAEVLRTDADAPKCLPR
jgi:quercetin dioxygenase-like cupin family protein